MADPTLDPFNPRARSHWIRLRTLIVLRWIAIFGQLAAILVAEEVFLLSLDRTLCYLVIGTLAVTNVVATLGFPQNKRLSESEAVTMLLFDILQLSALLYLTGGLHNPFALLILAPVTISATALQLRATVLLGAVALALVSYVAVFNMPLVREDGTSLSMPQDFVFGFWAAIVIGLAFLAGYARRISKEIHDMADALLATQMALEREQKLTDLGGVVAAAAHELGTPLATIKLVGTELLGELTDPDHRDDAALIRDQADRCRDILRSMGRVGKDDRHLRRAPLDTVVREAAEPHQARGRQLIFSVLPAAGALAQQPEIERQPEIIHGLRNLIQNAVDFSTSTVWVDATWSLEEIRVQIGDDGAGYPAQVIGRLGDPFLRHREAADLPEAGPRPGYEGMGLGLFIAKTLLERSGATLTFSNGTDPFLTSEEHPERCGAIVQVRWPRERVASPPRMLGLGLGRNEPIQA